MKHEAINSEYLTAAYVCVSVVVVVLLCVLAYVTCSRKFKLNWFERTQLESAKCMDENPTPIAGKMIEEQTILRPPGSGVKSMRVLRSQSSSGRLDSPPPTVAKEFWVPVSIQRQASFCQSDGPNEFSGEDSVPDTPNTPLGIKVSPFALSHMSQPDRGMSPLVKNVQPQPQPAARPKVVSMYGKLDHTKIDATLYQEERQSSVETPEDGPGGAVSFSVTYNPQFSLLCIHLVKARNLVPKDISGTADPYAKVRLLPDVNTWRESSTQWKTLSPIFDEELVFDVPEPELKERTLEIFLFDFDSNSRHQCLGKAEMPLSQINFQENTPFWKGIFLCDHKDDKPELGDLMFSVGYLQSAERLTVVVLKARNLRPPEDSKTRDPFVKVAIFQNGRRLKKKKTNVQRNTQNPVFNEALSFNNVTKDALKSISLEISVMNDNMLGHKEVLGTVIVGPNSKGDEAIQRRNLLTGRSPAAMWHPLIVITTSPNERSQAVE